MATATKDKSKKAGKKVAEVVEETEAHGRGRVQGEMSKRIAKLRNDEGLGWSEIAEQVGAGVGKVRYLYLLESVPADERIEAKNDSDLAKKIVSARDKQKLSWADISVRSGVAESRCRKIYEDTTGVSGLGNRIGKGGRYPNGAERPAAAPKAAKAAKTGAKATTKQGQREAAAENAPVKVTPEMAKKPLGDMSLAELQARLNTRTITVNKQGGGTEKIVVKKVSKLKDGEMTISDKDGKTRTLLVAQIAKATR